MVKERNAKGGHQAATAVKAAPVHPSIKLTHVALGYPTPLKGMAISKMTPVLKACKSKGEESETGIMFLPKDASGPYIELADTGSGRNGDMDWDAKLGEQPNEREFILPTANPVLFNKLLALLKIGPEHGGFKLSFVQAEVRSAKFHLGFHLPDGKQALLLRDLLRTAEDPELKNLAELVIKRRDKQGRRAPESGEFRLPLGSGGDEIEITYGPYGLEGHLMSPKRKPVDRTSRAEQSPWYVISGGSVTHGRGQRSRI